MKEELAVFAGQAWIVRRSEPFVWRQQPEFLLNWRLPTVGRSGASGDLLVALRLLLSLPVVVALCGPCPSTRSFLARRMRHTGKPAGAGPPSQHRSLHEQVAARAHPGRAGGPVRGHACKLQLAPRPRPRQDAQDQESPSCHCRSRAACTEKSGARKVGRQAHSRHFARPFWPGT